MALNLNSSNKCTDINCEYCQSGTCLLCFYGYYWNGTSCVNSNSCLYDRINRQCESSFTPVSTIDLMIDAIT